MDLAQAFPAENQLRNTYGLPLFDNTFMRNPYFSYSAVNGGPQTVAFGAPPGVQDAIRRAAAGPAPPAQQTVAPPSPQPPRTFHQCGGACGRPAAAAFLPPPDRSASLIVPALLVVLIVLVAVDVGLHIRAAGAPR